MKRARELGKAAPTLTIWKYEKLASGTSGASPETSRLRPIHGSGHQVVPRCRDVAPPLPTRRLLASSNSEVGAVRLRDDGRFVFAPSRFDPPAFGLGHPRLGGWSRGHARSS